MFCKNLNQNYTDEKNKPCAKKEKLYAQIKNGSKRDKVIKEECERSFSKLFLKITLSICYTHKLPRFFDRRAIKIKFKISNIEY